jgi:hypothetical protein
MTLHNDPRHAADLENQSRSLATVAREVTAVEFHDGKDEKFLKIRLADKRNRSLFLSLGALIAKLFEAPFLRVATSRDPSDPGDAPQRAYRQNKPDKFFKSDVTVSRTKRAPTELSAEDIAKLTRIAAGLNFADAGDRARFRDRVRTQAAAMSRPGRKLGAVAAVARADAYIVLVLERAAAVVKAPRAHG